MVIVNKLLEELADFNDEQLEFIVYNGGRAVVPEISRIYELLKKKGREDLISYLEYVWEKYGNPTPVKCPKCGFRAVVPDYSCLICGYVVSEEYIRKVLGFNEKFKEYVENASAAELRDIAQLGYVLVGENGVFSPRYRHKLVFERKYFYPIYLKAHEYTLIYDELSKRKIEI